MNILCSINESYIRQFKCMIFSLAESQSVPINLFFLNGSLSNYQIENLKQYTEALNIRFNLINIPSELISRLLKIREGSLKEISRFFSVEIYFRIFAHLLLPEEITRILWLDCDCIVQRDLYKFYNFNFMNSYGFVTVDAYETDEGQKDYVREYVKKPIGLEDYDIMFNSGVFLMNLTQIRKDETFSLENLCKVILEKPELKYDQDILNYLLKNKVVINSSFNYNYPPNWSSFEDIEETIHERYILHYYGMDKPWLDTTNNSVLCVQPWKRCEKMSYIIDKLIGTKY